MQALSVVQWVGSGLSLAAFIVGAALLAYRSRLKQRTQIINSARAEDRIEAINALAEAFRVDISGLPPAQQENIVLAQIRIRARREFLIAGLGFIIAALFFVIVIISIIFPNGVPIERHVTKTIQGGPAILQPGETRAFNIDLGVQGAVNVFINNITPDWTGRAVQKAAWMKAGKGNTPELWINICSSAQESACPDGVQKGINGTFMRDLPAGPATVIFFNFGTSPPVTFSTTINHPG